MLDLAYPAAVLGFFLLSWGYLRFLAWLEK
jgi:hypothetical protein